MQDKFFKAALVLEGGGNRGVFTAGVLDVLMEEGIWLDYTVGVSAGACNAVDYASRQIGRTRQCMINEDPAHKSITLRNVIKNRELFDMDLIFEDFPRRIYPFDFKRFFKGDTFCEAVITDCETGEPLYISEYKDEDRLLKVIRASASLPGLVSFVEIDGRLYCDGGVADPIPVLRPLSKGYDKQVVVLTRERGYRKSDNFGKFIFSQPFQLKYKDLYEKMRKQYLLYNQTLERVEKWEDEGKIFVIRPTHQNVDKSTVDVNALESFYQQGRLIGGQQLNQLLEYLSRK